MKFRNNYHSQAAIGKPYFVYDRKKIFVMLAGGAVLAVLTSSWITMPNESFTALMFGPASTFSLIIGSLASTVMGYGIHWALSKKGPITQKVEFCEKDRELL